MKNNNTTDNTLSKTAGNNGALLPSSQTVFMMINHSAALSRRYLFLTTVRCAPQSTSTLAESRELVVELKLTLILKIELSLIGSILG
jgi:hypothetical protein